MKAKARLSDSRLANLAAAAVRDAFVAYHQKFRKLTSRAARRFSEQDWVGLQQDSYQRLLLYRPAVDQAVEALTRLLEERRAEKKLWVATKAVFSGLIDGRDDFELAETFFNSVTRQIFFTVGLDPQIEFVDSDFEIPSISGKQAVYRKYSGYRPVLEIVREVLTDFAPHPGYEDSEATLRSVAETVEGHLRKVSSSALVEHLDVVDAFFYRGNKAFLIGRLCVGLVILPLVIALRHGHTGLLVDAVLMRENDISIVFSFTRSYFHVKVSRPFELIRFLQSLMPRKRAAELYNQIGYNRHGKTELYRDLLHQLSATDHRFELAPGTPGLVMIAFVISDYDLVFKVIRDVFPAVKRTSAESIRQKYAMIFHHDRAGRLVEASAFEHLKFSRSRFSPDLLEELKRDATKSVEITEEHVIVHHAYVERRVVPLNLYLRDADAGAARAAIIEYGQTMRDLAATNVFPGDLLLKNFGVTRHGRVVFYDYDEVCALGDINFRRMPQARTYEDELAAEPWFHVGENDVFPEEFETFLGLSAENLELFKEYHADLLDPLWWQSMQDRLADGELIHIDPYDHRAKLNKS